MRVEFPEWAQPLFTPKRYKVLYGGRGSGKSWAVARALLIQAAQKPLRVLCTREVQKSIKDSVHKLLADQVAAMGLGAFYEVLETTIRGANGSEFIFAGLQQHTVDSIKSYEGVDRVWIEEAHSVSKKSWDVLIPTIRKPESEVWVTFNPQLDTDEAFVRFVKNPPASVWSAKVNYSENPWFPEVLEAERQEAKRSMREAEYRYIWEGDTLPAVEGAIYFEEVAKAEADKRIGLFPMDPMLKVHRIWDMGWNDCMAIILAQRQGNAITCVGYVTGTHRKTSDYIADFKSEKYKGWNWGHDFLPHDGFAKNRQTGNSDAGILTGLGCSVMPTPNIEVEQGIRMARMVFPRIYIDKNACESDDKQLPGLVECLKRYRRRINQVTNTAAEPLHDVHSNGADAFRYLALNADNLTNEEWGGSLKYPKLTHA